MKQRIVAAVSLCVSLGLTVGCADPKGSFDQINIKPADMNGIIGGSDLNEGDPLSKSIVSVYDLESGGLCTGSLYTEDTIITAAHCIPNDAASLRVVFGVDLDDAGIIIRGVEATRVSPLWSYRQDMATDTGDIALVKLKGALPAGYRPAQMLNSRFNLKDGSEVVLAGYGISDGVNKEGAGRLRQVAVRVAQAVFGKTEVLLDQRSGKGACHGDSGGPAYLNQNGNHYLFGVTSRGINDDNDDCSQFAAYTNILAYEKWVADTTAELREGQAGPTNVLAIGNPVLPVGF